MKIENCFIISKGVDNLFLSTLQKSIREEDWMKLLTRLTHLEMVGTHGVVPFSKINNDKSSCYWHRQLLETYAENLCNEPTDSTNLHVCIACCRI